MTEIIAPDQPVLEQVDIVIPVYNEEDTVLEFHKRLVAIVDQLPYQFNLYYIDDGSSDHTLLQLVALCQKDERISVVQLSRNFGHQAALTAGLDIADGDMVITMDGDGQHPPELIPALIEHYHEGFDIVQTQRLDDPKTSFFKRWSARVFYWLINKLGNTKVVPGTADFRLMSHSAVMAIRQMGEYHRFIRGMVPWLGYKTFMLPYSPQNRISGKSKYTFAKMYSLAENAIFSFSLVPLRIGLFLGGFFLLLAIAEAIYVITFWVSGRQSNLVPGWSSTVFLILITGGSLMIMISLLGIYIGQIHQEVKHRPIYIIKSKNHK